jgi:quercetin dioxygenase-like cupin family protein
MSPARTAAIFARTVVAGLLVWSFVATGIGGNAAAQGQMDGVTEDLLALTEIENTNPQQVVVLTRVTVEPGGTTGLHVHQGVSNLWVESGTLCFKIVGIGNRTGEVEVTFQPDRRITDSACAPVPITTCPDFEPCTATATVVAPATFILTAGDWVSQDENIQHSYTNIGTTDAVVLISELQTWDGVSPCRGGCG